MSFTKQAIAAAVLAIGAPAFALTSSSFGGAHDPVESATGVYIGSTGFLDQFSFTLSGLVTLTSNSSFDGIVNGWYTVRDSSAASLGTWALGSGVHSLTLGAGSYAYEVTGSSPGLGLYSLSSAVTPVPEPETYAMMLAGLVALGFMARRRS